MVDFTVDWSSFWFGGIAVPVGLVAGFVVLMYALRWADAALRWLWDNRHVMWYRIKYLGVNREKVRAAQLAAANEGRETPIALVYSHPISLHPVRAIEANRAWTTNRRDCGRGLDKTNHPRVPEALEAARAVGFRFNRNGIKKRVDVE